MRHALTFGLFALVFGCSTPEESPADLGEVETAVRALYQSVSAYDFDGLRAVTTEDFEIIEAGARMDLAGFEALLGSMQERGNELQFEPSEFNTVMVGNVAYASVRAENLASGSVFLDSFVLQRVNGAWLVDRTSSTRQR